MPLSNILNLYSQGLAGGGATAQAGAAGTPPIKANMQPPANFWEGNNFRIGAPGLQETPVTDPSHPANPAQPQTPAQPQLPTPQTPPPPAWQSYIDGRPDIVSAYSEQNMANSPHLLGGGGRGADLDSNGSISRPEYYQWHYNTMGPGSGSQAASSPPPSGQAQTPAPSFPSVGGGAGGSAGRNPFIPYMGAGMSNPFIGAM